MSATMRIVIRGGPNASPHNRIMCLLVDTINDPTKSEADREQAKRLFVAIERLA